VVSFDSEDLDQRPTTSLDVDVSRLSVEKFSSWSDDSLEAVLRRRIADLEDIEEHLRRQVVLQQQYCLNHKVSATETMFSTAVYDLPSDGKRFDLVITHCFDHRSCSTPTLVSTGMQ